MKKKTTSKKVNAEEKAKMLEVIFGKMNKYGVIRYSDDTCSVMLDPTGEMKKSSSMEDFEPNQKGVLNPYLESKT